MVQELLKLLSMRQFLYKNGKIGERDLFDFLVLFAQNRVFDDVSSSSFSFLIFFFLLLLAHHYKDNSTANIIMCQVCGLCIRKRDKTVKRNEKLLVLPNVWAFSTFEGRQSNVGISDRCMVR